MFNVKIGKEYLVYQQGTSEGTQVKFKKGGYWYKLDSRGNEGLCEYLCSRLLHFSNLNPEEYVIYEQGTINDKNGCRSQNFLNKDEELITLYRLYYNQYGLNLAEKLAEFDTLEDRIEYTLRFVYKTTGLDIFDYLRKTFMLDKIVLNEDRHVNNLALISTDKGFRPAPIFDNGKSLLTANVSINKKLSIEENTKRTIARPFSGSFEKTSNYFGDGFSLDYESVFEWLNDEPDSYEKAVLEFQLKKYFG